MTGLCVQGRSVSGADEVVLTAVALIREGGEVEVYVVLEWACFRPYGH